MTEAQKALRAELSAHILAMAQHTDWKARREAEAVGFATETTGNEALDPVAIAHAIIPPTAEITPPDKFRAYIFKTEICERLKAFGFDPRFWTDNLFANVAPKSREAKQAWTLADLKRRLTGEGAIVALIGERGLGKTTLAAQVAIQRLWEDWEAAQEVQEYRSSFDRKPVPRRSTLYRKLTAIVGKLKALYADFGTVSIEKLESERDHLCGVSLLVIDELNECADDSKHKDRILTDILDRRYSAKRDTILVTNQTKADFEATVNPSIRSRMNEHGGIIGCNWPSFRDQKCITS